MCRKNGKAGWKERQRKSKLDRVRQLGVLAWRKTSVPEIKCRKKIKRDTPLWTDTLTSATWREIIIIRFAYCCVFVFN